MSTWIRLQCDVLSFLWFIKVQCVIAQQSIVQSPTLDVHLATIAMHCDLVHQSTMQYITGGHPANSTSTWKTSKRKSNASLLHLGWTWNIELWYYGIMVSHIGEAGIWLAICPLGRPETESLPLHSYRSVSHIGVVPLLVCSWLAICLTYIHLKNLGEKCTI